MSHQSPQKTALLKIENPQTKNIEINGIALEGDTIEISPETSLIIGRNPQIANFTLYDISTDSSVSRVHCTITYNQEYQRFMLTDAGSSNGTFLNDERLQPHEATQLHNEDVIRLGTLNLRGVQLVFSTEVTNGQNSDRRLVVKPARLPKGTAVNIGKLIKSVLPQIDDSEGKDTDEVVVDPLATTIIDPNDIFISYSHADVDIMKTIMAYLIEKGGFKVWTDEKLKSSTDSWQVGVEVALETSRCVVVLMSPDSKQSPWVRRELNYAESQGIELIPTLVEGDQHVSVPLVLAEHQYIDLRGDLLHESLSELVTTIQKHLNQIDSDNT